MAKKYTGIVTNVEKTSCKQRDKDFIGDLWCQWVSQKIGPNGPLKEDREFPRKENSQVPRWVWNTQSQWPGIFSILIWKQALCARKPFHPSQTRMVVSLIGAKGPGISWQCHETVGGLHWEASFQGKWQEHLERTDAHTEVFGISLCSVMAIYKKV